jgi:hypothetical protein
MVNIMVRMSLLETTLAVRIKSVVPEIEAVLSLMRVLDEIMKSCPRNAVIQRFNARFVLGRTCRQR